MLERIEKAIKDCSGRTHRNTSKDIAVAVLDAMREPSALVTAGMEAGVKLTAGEVVAVWQAMIEEAKKDVV